MFLHGNHISSKACSELPQHGPILALGAANSLSFGDSFEIHIVLVIARSDCARAPLQFLSREATSLQAGCSSPFECLLTQQLQQQDASPLPARFHPDQLTQAAAAASVGDWALLFKIPSSTRLRQITPRPWPWLQPCTLTTTSSSSSSSSRRLIRSRVAVVEAHRAEAGAAARQLRGSILQQDLVPFTFSSYTCRFLGFQYKRQGRTAGLSFELSRAVCAEQAPPSTQLPQFLPSLRHGPDCARRWFPH